MLSFGVFVEELGDVIDLLWGLRQFSEHIHLFPLSPFGRTGGEEKP